MGCGRFSDLLTYEEWVKFNCAQRGHQNALETQPAALATLFASGSLYPITASILGGAYGVGRILYAAGYIRSGPGGRLIGVLLADVGLLGLIGCAIRAGLKVAGVA
jgi:glutathione S-transferase